MALADTARLIATLDLKGNFDARIRASEKALGSFDTKLDKTQGRAFRAGQQIGTGIQRSAVLAAGAVGFLAANVGVGLKSLTELESITTQTNAVLKSTKGVAGETADSIRNLAEKYESLNATIDDKVIQSAENVLLTFTAIRKDAFEPAIAAALDMSTALGTDLQGSVIQIGKALQDPIKGITALRRVGVNFSKDQITVIKRLVDTGHTMEAQKLILKELNTEFGGSFLAGGNTTAGKVAKFKDSIEDLQKALASALLPTIGKVADGLSKFLADPEVIRGVTELGQKIASLFSDKNLATGGQFLKDAFETAKSAAPIVEASARATFGLVQSAVGLFRSLPPEIQKLAVGAFAVNKLTGGLVTNIAGGIIDVVGKNFLQRGGTPANPLFVADVSGGVSGGAGVAGAAGASKLGKVVSAVGKVFLVGAAVGTFAELKGILDDQSGRNREQAAGLSAQTTAFTRVAGIDDMKKSLAGIEQQQRDLNKGITGESLAFAFNIDGVRDTIEAQAATLRAAIADAEGKSAAMQVHATDRAEAIASGKADAIRRAQAAAAVAVRRVEAAENRAATTISARVGAKIAAAQRAPAYAQHATTQAIKDKDLSVAINNQIGVTATVSNRESSRATVSFSRLYKVPT